AVCGRPRRFHPGRHRARARGRRERCRAGEARCIRRGDAAARRGRGLAGVGGPWPAVKEHRAPTASTPDTAATLLQPPTLGPRMSDILQRILARKVEEITERSARLPLVEL